MKTSKLINSYLILPMMLLTSCGTIMHGTRQSIGISSNPTKAHVWIDGQFHGETPMIVKLSRGDNHTLKLQLDGYLPYEAIFTKQLSGWVFGNIVFGGILGVAIDAISGGIYRLTPEQVDAQLCNNNIVCTNKNNNSYVSIVLEVDPSWEKIGQLAKN